MRQTERLAADTAGLARAAAILRRGGLVAFPTETVYGLGADATDAEAVARIYAAKDRPSFNPLIAHVDSFRTAQNQGIFDETAARLAEAFWPGPLTLVVPVASTCTISDLARAGLDSIGLRVPAHPLAHALLEQTGRPVAAPSANRSGRVSPTDADHVLGDLEGRIDAVLDGGVSQVGLESTIVSCLGGVPRLLRPGGVPREAIEALLGRKLEAGPEAGSNPLAPGMLASHYAPRARVRLNATSVQPGEAALLFGAETPLGIETAQATLNLSQSGDLVEAAAHLFSYLRQLDASGAATIAVSPVPENGLGEAINDRLRRAAAER
ncbi:L-threonylcarbamoyladenylate synthase [Microvirga sp. CF3016]|uniref:L-threonylcarbamoyladenylate synthase n=1 Tax=Microvirga sp. CF3016 TaxID=3110181 RepID=UPI002E78B65B|nr:L-threonylcarbamoyladenylate synthase [Microvirga sp. CF3016]MEE1610254.1 L-threonylcarbamoyladenylate synthase [Microvirga sp. CF3016]